MRLAAFLQITLVIFFGAPERWSWLDLCNDRAIKPAAFFESFFRIQSGSLLLRRVIKNYRAILRADIGALSIQRGGIMIRPENIQELIVADLRWIEFNVHHFGMPGLIGANILICRIILRPPPTPDAGRQNTFYIAERSFDTTETSRTECGFLSLHGTR